MENEKLETFNMQETSKRKHIIGGTKVGQAEEVRKSFIILKLKIKFSTSA